MLPITSPNVTAQRSALTRSNLCGDLGVAGREGKAKSRARMPMGRLTANSHGHGAMARMALAMVGPAAAERAMTSAFRPRAK
jgi:hypothetical protein